MTTSLTRAARYFLLFDMFKAMYLRLKHLFAPKANVSYAFGKRTLSSRYGYDQLMRLGWKVFLPFSLAWVVIVAFFAQFGAFGGAYARWVVGG